MLNKIFRVIKMARLTYSSKYAMKVANDYWQNTTITHSSMNEEQFDFYYKEILKIMKPNKQELILDYGGGNGEIAYRFKKDGYNIKHCDLSLKMVETAKRKYNLDSCECKKLGTEKYDKILFNNGFFYIHPSLIKKFLKNISNNLKVGGELYLMDNPDFYKRDMLRQGKVYIMVTKLFPVYQIDLAGFFVKNNQLESIAKKVGFAIKKYDSWANYRSHWVLTKVK